MKGPYERLKYDLRRVWECPVCRRHERTSGRVASLFCVCQQDLPPAERRCMKLIANGVRRVRPAHADREPKQPPKSD